MTVKLPKDYRPKEDEEFMNPKMREYFRLKLLQWKSDLQRESGETLQHLQEVSLHSPDLLTLFVRLVAGVIAGYVVFRVIETPFLRRSKRITIPSHRD
jgi:hypothetical protein